MGLPTSEANADDKILYIKNTDKTKVQYQLHNIPRMEPPTSWDPRLSKSTANTVQWPLVYTAVSSARENWPHQGEGGLSNVIRNGFHMAYQIKWPTITSYVLQPSVKDFAASA